MNKQNSVLKTPKLIELVRQFTQKERTKFSHFIRKNASDKVLITIVEELNKLGVFNGKLFDRTIFSMGGIREKSYL